MTESTTSKLTALGILAESGYPPYLIGIVEQLPEYQQWSVVRSLASALSILDYPMSDQLSLDVNIHHESNNSSPLGPHLGPWDMVDLYAIDRQAEIVPPHPQSPNR